MLQVISNRSLLFLVKTFFSQKSVYPVQKLNTS